MPQSCRRRLEKSRARSRTSSEVATRHRLLHHRPNLSSMVPSSKRKEPEQLKLDAMRYRTGRGGPRHDAGRPRGIRPRVMHRRREGIVARVPVHVTIRLRRDVPTLRQPRFVRRFRCSLSEACTGTASVSCTTRSSAITCTCCDRGSNQLLHRLRNEERRRSIGKLANWLFERKGKVLDGRYHLRPRRTPLEVHRALRYVLLNHRHHAAKRRSQHHRAEHVMAQPDPASSGRWFNGWRIATAPPNLNDICEVASARTWLLRTSWRRHGLIHPADVP